MESVQQRMESNRERSESMYRRLEIIHSELERIRWRSEAWKVSVFAGWTELIATCYWASFLAHIALQQPIPTDRHDTTNGWTSEKLPSVRKWRMNTPPGLNGSGG